MKLKRFLDFTVAVSLLALTLPITLVVALAVRCTSPGPVLHWSDRVGKGNNNFAMAKFRTMKTDTPNVATHLLDDPAQWLTPPGSFLRRSSLDELPQLWHVAKGEMSLVGPRPALFNQDDLIELRTQMKVHHLRPGITGLAQIEGRDDLSIPDKVALDKRYVDEKSMLTDLIILARTAAAVVQQRSVHVE